MLTDSQINTLLILRNREGNIFSQLPDEILYHIYKTKDVPNSTIARLVQAVAYGNLDVVKTMLNTDPRLLLQASHVSLPSGDMVSKVTPYECALGAGDDEMAKIISSYFAKIKGGEKEQAHQYAKYKSSIDNMPHQQVYDFKSLFEIINNSSHEDIAAALNKDFEYQSVLNDALAEFRETFQPRWIKKGMHFNYVNMLKVLEIFDLESLKAGLYFKDDKYRLGWQQVCGFVMRGLPACDRQVLAQGLIDVALSKKPVIRSFKCQFGGGEIPVVSDNSHTGLGFDYAINEHGTLSKTRQSSDVSFFVEVLEKFYQTKMENLQSLDIQPEKEEGYSHDEQNRLEA
ncbi:hypothetical protein [Legionella hackeliae]|uniref:Uncharacterized protein n=1 Tax=Legionella hackeliae TaxID=449 RepID=A0A0A8UK02_LEGHA|nr:hypothetical protein [Legionella hackeliae]KTD12861.1 hypothetical protein Lhac_1732 [Legionella hackeliae]CEK09165.1 protein of unknown function [Legionella hackeliae]STX49075.1 Uncharacterised protein [Legionella hackeliae]